jgi:hypothetical protein
VQEALTSHQLSSKLEFAGTDGMVAKTTTRPSAIDEAAPVSRAGLSGWHSWRLVKRCQTLESALEVMKQLKDRGQMSQLVMEDGLSVVTQRV